MPDEKTIEWVMWAMRSLRQDHAEITPEKVHEFLRQRAIPLSQDDVGAVLIEISHRRSQWQGTQDHDLNRRLLERLLDEHGLPAQITPSPSKQRHGVSLISLPVAKLSPKPSRL